MSTTTINITLPTQLKKQVEKQVKTNMYASISEYIRSAIRSMLASPAIPHNSSFSLKAEKEILKSLKTSLHNRNKNIVLKSNKDIDAFFDSL